MSNTISSSQGAAKDTSQSTATSKSTVVGGGAAGPTSAPSTQKMSALDRLKQVQQIFKQTWSGMQTEYTGRPGTCTICNSKRTFTKPEQLTVEEERSRQFEQIFTLLSNIENDNIPLLISSGQDR